jgi:hypothetical protein
MMATKPKKPATPTAEKFPRKAIPLILLQGDSEEVAARKFSALATSPELAAYRVIGAAEGTNPIGEQIDVPTLLEQLREQSAAVNRGEMMQAEAMLMNQATALQSLFVRLAEASMRASMLPQQETAMRLALKAQGQCRATLETLAAIKNPPVIYAKQVNQTTGPQQINNGATAPSQARGIENEQGKQSGAGQLLPDARASQAASRVNPALETVGEIDRAKVRRG